MFSSTMMASSTTIPTTRVRPSTVKVFKVKLRKYITMNVPRIEVGIARSTLIVVENDPRNSQQTNPVRSAARTSVSRISSIARSMNTVLSKRTPTLTPSGRSARICCSFALERWPTSTAFAPRSLRMPNPIEGSPLARATRRRSSSPSSTTATSCSRTGVPSRNATTSSRKPARSRASPSARTFISRWGVSMRPAGTSRCSRWMAPITSSTVRPCASSRRASNHTRTLRSRYPPMKTSPTPSTVWSCGRITLRT